MAVSGKPEREKHTLLTLLLYLLSIFFFMADENERIEILHKMYSQFHTLLICFYSEDELAR